MESSLGIITDGSSLVGLSLVGSSLVGYNWRGHHWSGHHSFDERQLLVIAHVHVIINRVSGSGRWRRHRKRCLVSLSIQPKHGTATIPPKESTGSMIASS